MDTTEQVNEIIIENALSTNGKGLIKKIVEQCYDNGGINEEYYNEFLYFHEKKLKPILRVIFAAKQKIDTTTDITYDDLIIKENPKGYLIYVMPSYGTITWNDLRRAFTQCFNNNIHELEDRIRCNAKGAEKIFYEQYIKYIRRYYNNEEKFREGNYPNLLPQFALENRALTKGELNNSPKELIHRIDFGMVLNNRVILIEIDGFDHYNNMTTIAAERKIERELTLRNYEVYKFTNNEIENKDEYDLEILIKHFFDKLFQKHSIKL